MLSLFFLARRVTDTPECQGRLSRWSARCFATFSMKMIKFQTCTLLESCLVMSFHGTQAEDSLGLSLSKSETLAKLNSIPLIWEKIYCQVNTHSHTLHSTSFSWEGAACTTVNVQPGSSHTNSPSEQNGDWLRIREELKFLATILLLDT